MEASRTSGVYYHLFTIHHGVNDVAIYHEREATRASGSDAARAVVAGRYERGVIRDDNGHRVSRRRVQRDHALAR